MKNIKTRILIVDDEEDLCEILQYNLDHAGFSTEIAHSSEEAIKKPLHNFDMFILDVMMGAMSGFRLAEKIRNEFKSDSPIIFLTAKDTENDILTGFSLGGDDYIARVKAIIKRSDIESRNENDVQKYGSVELDNVRKLVIVDKKRIDLTRKEYEILKLLLENNGKIFSREDILRRVWGGEVIVSDRTVDVNIARLRSKLGKHGLILKNKTGFGYYCEF
jgi:two-component system alkaline phosphatase synthesis response regulator PhoP